MQEDDPAQDEVYKVLLLILNAQDASDFASKELAMQILGRLAVVPRNSR